MRLQAEQMLQQRKKGLDSWSPAASRTPVVWPRRAGARA